MSDSKKPFAEIDADSFTLSGFDTEPIEGYDPPINKETGEKFPQCCPFHKGVLEHAQKWYDLFPNCCEAHKKFIGKLWFKRENYTNIATEILNKLSYTEHHLQTRINTADWYTDITDYIEYTAYSFGHPAVGLHIYFEHLKHAITSTKIDIEQSKRDKLADYVDSFYKADNNASAPDLNALYSTYREWFRIFPFELNSYFGKLKEQYSSTFPILTGPVRVNKYSGQASAKIHTKESFIEFLTKLTDDLLVKINAETLFEKGLIKDVDKLKLELIINSRKQKLKEGYRYSSPDQHTQIKKMIKYWFKDEKIFIDDISPLIKNENIPEGQLDQKQSPITFKDIFTVSDWSKYVEALQHCNPALLNADNRFIGSPKRQKGVIAAWFKFLKTKGIIDQSLNRDALAKILSSEIKNFTISGASIDNVSSTYGDFEPQLRKLCGLD